LFTGGKEIR